MNAELTARQRDIYDLIVQYILYEQRPPTVREICRHFGISSPNGVVCHLKALEKKGVIQRSGNSRGIRLVADGNPFDACRDEQAEDVVRRFFDAIPDAPAPVVIWLEQILSQEN